MFVEVTACVSVIDVPLKGTILLTLGTDHVVFKWYSHFCRKKCFLRLSIQQCCLIQQSSSDANVTTALLLLVADLFPAQACSAGCATMKPPLQEQETSLLAGQVKAPAARRQCAQVQLHKHTVLPAMDNHGPRIRWVTGLDPSQES